MYRQVLRMRALDRWENEGGSIEVRNAEAVSQRSVNQRGSTNDVSPLAELPDNYTQRCVER